MIIVYILRVKYARVLLYSHQYMRTLEYLLRVMQCIATGLSQAGGWGG